MSDNTQKPAEPKVAAANAAVLKELPFENRQDFEDAKRGFIASLPDATIKGANDRTVWSVKDYEFLKNETAPDTVNPSLWRQAQLNLEHGLFKVVDGIYQIRGFDISNMTLIEGDTGVIVIDPLTAGEVAKAGIELYFAHRGKKPVVAVIYTHTHTDHWGGVKGVISEADVAAGVPVIAPDKFMEFAVSENVIAGNAMLRRAHYQFGPLLPKGERGQVDAGLGKTVCAGSVALIAPTDLITHTGETRTIDGVEIVFQMAPGSEAPAEFHMYYPRFKTLNMAENCTHNFHNLLPFRGSEVRDAKAWGKYINEAIELFGDKSDVLIGQHHWPVWGRDRIRHFMTKQRDLYTYVHDQTLRLLNHGYTAAEIAEQLELPPSLSHEWANRGYYGTVRHNCKAIYQKYLGWFDANPANLDPLPPVPAARKYVEYMGGADKVIERARADFKAGDYRWVAEAMKHVVFADTDNLEARALGADAFEQLGYISEAATWRNAYLFGAHELRHGMPKMPSRTPVSPGTVKALTIDMVFDLMGVRLNGPKAEGKRIVINWNFTDPQGGAAQPYVLNLENAALTYVAGKQAANADVSFTLARATLDAITLKQTTFQEAVAAGKIQFTGNPSSLAELYGLLDEFQRMFEIVEPKRGVG